MSGHNKRCVCTIHEKDNPILLFLANGFVGDGLYFRVAANTDRGQSDFTPYKGVQVQIGELCTTTCYLYWGQRSQLSGTYLHAMGC